MNSVKKTIWGVDGRNVTYAELTSEFMISVLKYVCNVIIVL